MLAIALTCQSRIRHCGRTVTRTYVRPPLRHAHKPLLWSAGFLMRLVIFIATIAVGCASAQAQPPEHLNRESLLPMLGTISVEVTPNFTDGRLDGCSIGFRTLAQDWIYKQGAFIAVSGGFGVMTIKGTYAAYLKVTVHDVDPRTMQFTQPPSKRLFRSRQHNDQKRNRRQYSIRRAGYNFCCFACRRDFSCLQQRPCGRQGDYRIWQKKR